MRWIPYTSGRASIEYLDGVSIDNDTFEPEVLNPGEIVEMQIRVNPPLGTGTTRLGYRIDRERGHRFGERERHRSRTMTQSAWGETRRVVATGNPEIDKKIGGGIPEGSLSLIEGQSDAGKSVLVQQLIWGALQDGLPGRLLHDGEHDAKPPPPDGEPEHEHHGLLSCWAS